MNRPYKLLLLSSLYLAQGLPFGFFTQALPVLLRERGLSLAMISATSFLFLPWALKFLWAPLVDKWGTPKHWIMALQLMTCAGAFGLSFVDLEQNLELIFVALLLFNLFAATQDIATDGLAVRLLSSQERGLGNGIQVGAYRIGMIIGGGALLWIFAQFGWSSMFLGMAFVLALTCIPIWFLRQPQEPESSNIEEPHQSFQSLLLDWVQRLNQPGFVTFIGLICFYKFGDAMASSVVGPFMHDAGLSKEDIALIKGTVGSSMGLLGAAAGGWLAWKLGRRRALLICGILQTLSLLPYYAATQAEGEWIRSLIIVASTGEHLLGGMATVALFTLMMDACDRNHAGTDYTVLASSIVIVGAVSSISAGLMGDHLGYDAVFLTGTLLSGLGCAVLVLAINRKAGPLRLQAVWNGGPGVN